MSTEKPPQKRRLQVLTPEVAAKITQSIRNGNFPKTAARYAGVSEQNIHAWVRQGEGRDNELEATAETSAFAVALRQAEAECEAVLVDTIYEKAKRDPYLALKYLSRRFKDRWGDGSNVNKTPMDEQIIQRTVEMIRQELIGREELEGELGPELTEELFARASQKVTVGKHGS